MYLGIASIKYVYTKLYIIVTKYPCTTASNGAVWLYVDSVIHEFCYTKMYWEVIYKYII